MNKCLFLCFLTVQTTSSTAQRVFQFIYHQLLSYLKLFSEICFKQHQYQIQRLYSGSKVKVFKNWNLVFEKHQRRETAVEHYPKSFRTNSWLSAWFAHLWNTPVELLGWFFFIKMWTSKYLQPNCWFSLFQSQRFYEEFFYTNTWILKHTSQLFKFEVFLQTHSLIPLCPSSPWPQWHLSKARLQFCLNLNVKPKCT